MSAGRRVGYRVQAGISVPFHLAETRRALAARRPLLRVYELLGEVLSLGRYHLAPAGARGVVLHRRHTGGRAVAQGAGFVGVSLVLPHRSALVADEPLALAPAQVMNRYVRGVLKGLETLGVPAFYPGRDVITVEQRIVGLASFEIDRAGTLLFEAILADREAFSRLPALLDAVDPAGVVPARMLGPEDTTSLLARGVTTTLEALAEAIRRGYAAAFDVTLEDAGAADPAATDDPTWVAARARPPSLARRATSRIQTGALEIWVAVADGAIRDVLMSGDFIADSPGIETLEARLRGCAANATAVAGVVEAVFASPEHFVLGIGSLGTLIETIVRALP